MMRWSSEGSVRTKVLGLLMAGAVAVAGGCEFDIAGPVTRSGGGSWGPYVAEQRVSAGRVDLLVVLRCPSDGGAFGLTQAGTNLKVRAGRWEYTVPQGRLVLIDGRLDACVVLADAPTGALGAFCRAIRKKPGVDLAPELKDLAAQVGDEKAALLVGQMVLDRPSDGPWREQHGISAAGKRLLGEAAPAAGEAPSR